jgi:hypothetical protein
MSFPIWCVNYLDDGNVGPSFTMETATAFATELAKRDDPKHVPNDFLDESEEVAMGLAAFAAVLVLLESDWMQTHALREWCRKQLLVAASRPEPVGDLGSHGESRYSPGYRRSAARALPKLLEDSPADQEVLHAIAALARHQNCEVREFLFMAAKPLWESLPRVVWSLVDAAIADAKLAGIALKYRSLQFEPRIAFMESRHPRLKRFWVRILRGMEVALASISRGRLRGVNAADMDIRLLSPMLLLLPVGRDAATFAPKARYRRLLRGLLVSTLAAFEQSAREDRHYNEWSNYLHWNMPVFRACASAVLRWSESDSTPLLNAVMEAWDQAPDILKLFLMELFEQCADINLVDKVVSLWPSIGRRVPASPLCSAREIRFDDGVRDSLGLLVFTDPYGATEWKVRVWPPLRRLVAWIDEWCRAVGHLPACYARLTQLLSTIGFELMPDHGVAWLSDCASRAESFDELIGENRLGQALAELLRKTWEVFGREVGADTERRSKFIRLVDQLAALGEPVAVALQSDVR